MPNERFVYVLTGLIVIGTAGTWFVGEMPPATAKL